MTFVSADLFSDNQSSSFCFSDNQTQGLCTFVDNQTNFIFTIKLPLQTVAASGSGVSSGSGFAVPGNKVTPTKSSSITQANLNNGISLTLQVNSTTTLPTHNLTVLNVNSGSADFVIQSSPQFFTLNVGQQKDVCLNDGVLSLTLNSVNQSQGSINLSIIQKSLGITGCTTPGTGGAITNGTTPFSPPTISRNSMWIIVGVILLAIIIGGIMLKKRKKNRY